MSKATTAAQQTKKGTAAFPAGNLTPHPLSDLVPGEMSKEEFIALCTSIKEDGLQNPIVLFEGKILDGRHRHQACRELGIKGDYIEYKGKDAAAFVLDNNLHRRQLNSMQKAMVAARMHLRTPNPMPQKDAAARVGVGVATVNLAVRLVNSKNTPLIKRTESGETTRAEIDEILFDRAASSVTETVQPTDTAGGTDDDMPSVPGNVVEFESHPAVAGKRTSKPRASESPSSRVAQAFKGLTDKERANFVVLAWPWLEKALHAADKLPKVPRVQPQPIEAKPTKDQRKNYRKAIKASKKQAPAPLRKDVPAAPANKDKAPARQTKAA